MDVARIASAIGEPARTRMLYALMDGRSRTSTELASIAGVTPSTASAHLSRLQGDQLVRVIVQGKHHYYALEGPQVAAALEALQQLAGDPRHAFVPSTPTALRSARTCYDHIAGNLGVSLHDRFVSLRWLSDDYDLTAAGAAALERLGVDVEELRAQRRRFAYPCLDWSERRPHLAGALGAAILSVALKKKWIRQELDSRALSLTSHGRRELAARFGLSIAVA